MTQISQMSGGEWYHKNVRLNWKKARTGAEGNDERHQTVGRRVFSL
jgi:hypothetical protein